MRYAKATDDFYVPDADDVRTPGRQARRVLVRARRRRSSPSARARSCRRSTTRAYATYDAARRATASRASSRARVLPVGAYTEFYWTVNARALMNFVSLRRGRRPRSARSAATPRRCEQFLAERDADHARGVRRERPHRALRVERVTGIGGVFLRARDPEALRSWYEANLGITVSEWGGHVFEAVPGTSTVWSLFPGDTGYWPLEQQVMVNYRVDDLDAMLAAAARRGRRGRREGRGAGVRPLRLGGRSRGNRFELWQPLEP